MPGKHCKKTLANKPGKKVPGRGRVKRIRTKKIGKNKYMHIRVVSKKGKRGGTTVAGGVMTKKKARRRKRKKR